MKTFSKKLDTFKENLFMQWHSIVAYYEHYDGIGLSMFLSSSNQSHKIVFYRLIFDCSLALRGK